MAKAAKKKAIDNRDEIFVQLLDLIPHNKTQMEQLALDAEVSIYTLKNWVYGTTMAPRIDTLVKVSNALGHAIVLKRVRVKRKLRVVK